MLTINRTDAEALAENLTGSWEVTQESPGAIILTRADGLALALSGNDGKTHVSLTGLPHEHVRYNEKRPSINVTLTPARVRIVARDIAKRLLPDAEALWTTVQARIKDRHTYDTERLLIAAQLGVTIDDNGHARINEGAVWGDVDVYGDSVKLSLHSLAPEQAVAIMSLLRTL